MDAAEGSGPWGDYPRDAAGSGDPAATGRLAAVLLGSGEDVRAGLTWRPLGSASQRGYRCAGDLRGRTEPLTMALGRDLMMRNSPKGP